MASVMKLAVWNANTGAPPWRACASFDPAGGPLVNWLLVITGHTAIDMVKARVRRPPLTSVPADENAAVGGLSDIDRLILRFELRDALGSIGAHHRDTVIETVLRDRPHADVATELGVAPAPCGPGSTTGSGGCAACWKPRTPQPKIGTKAIGHRRVMAFGLKEKAMSRTDWAHASAHHVLARPGDA